MDRGTSKDDRAFRGEDWLEDLHRVVQVLLRGPELGLWHVHNVAAGQRDVVFELSSVEEFTYKFQLGSIRPPEMRSTSSSLAFVLNPPAKLTASIKLNLPSRPARF